MNKERAILLVSATALPLAQVIAKELRATIYYKGDAEDCRPIASYAEMLDSHFSKLDVLVFIGAMGICVRTIAPYLQDKYADPAILCVDSTGHFVISVASGHIGGGNDMARQIAAAIGGEAVITTQSDNTHLWALDTLGKQYNWLTEADRSAMNHLITRFVNKQRTALLVDVVDKGTLYLMQHLPDHVTLFRHFEEITQSDYDLLIAVTPHIYPTTLPTLYYRPRVLHVGVGCQHNISTEGMAEHLSEVIAEHHLSPLSIASLATIEIKKEEPLLTVLQAHWNHCPLHIYPAATLSSVEVPHPSQKVYDTVGVWGVAEACALQSAKGGKLLIEKLKGGIRAKEAYTLAVALDSDAMRTGHIEIVGAGPGDPDLVSVRGRQFLEQADLILYAGSLVPRELTFCAKPDAVVRSSASLNLEEQFALMKTFYDRGQLVVRLHTGDPCIYGAIEEQMRYFDDHKMSYHITPGISSFQAAAAALRSQFTIPEQVQTIILTRGEGRTPMPEKEKLHLLARSQSTMCIYLSASIVDEVQAELLQAYPPETPVAACYKLTWKDERIYRGVLSNLAKIVKENHLTLTTMIVVGFAIDNRTGFSKLYDRHFSHLFRK